MVFSSFTFLFLFLPLTLTIYYLAPRSLRNGVGLVTSLVFYGWGAPEIVPLLVVSCAVDYLLSKRIKGSQHPAALLAFAVSLNLLLLLYYKYSNFFIEEVNGFVTRVGFSQFPWHEVALPIGISFFTFQKISYLVDVYRGTAEVSRRYLDYLLYVVFFPQLIAGPIVRYHDVALQIRDRSYSVTKFQSGFIRFAIGLGKKVLIADQLGAVSDNVFSIESTALSSGYAWLGIFCYALQIYYDFSGYSDMALGLGRMLGFEFLENFNFPYISRSITEFWRRWHISLSNWMREYLYIPLGGNRLSVRRTYLNLWIVFFLSGLWHGAAWNFIFWGLYHGAFLILDRVFLLKLSERLPKLISVALTFLIVLVGWVFFRAETLSQALEYLARMFWISHPTQVLKVYPAEIIHNRGIATLVIASVATALPLLIKPERISGFFYGTTGRPLHLNSLIATLVFMFAVLALSGVAVSPFLYFRF